MWTSKAPIVLLYVRIFRVEGWLRRLGYGLLALTALAYILGATVSICPVKDLNPMDPTSMLYLGKCADKSSKAGVAVGAISVLTDVIILLLPIRSIVRMQLPLRKKVGVLCVFLTGIL